MQTPLQRAVESAGSQSALARLIGVDQQLVSYWMTKAKGRVPAEHVIPIERALEGKVTRHDLRPDLYPVEEPAPAEQRGAA